MNHRYMLRREWIGNGGIVNFLMLNPSTADDTFDDHTIRKCCGFAKRWGYRGIAVTNLFAFRATDPKTLHALMRAGEEKFSIGPENDTAIASAANKADIVVVAWGVNAAHYQNRIANVMKMLLRPSCIGVTKDGHPLHPCMAGYTDAPVIWQGATAVATPQAGQRHDVDGCDDPAVWPVTV